MSEELRQVTPPKAQVLCRVSGGWATLTECCLLWPEESGGSAGTGLGGCRLFGHHPGNKRMQHKGDPGVHLTPDSPSLPLWPRTLTRTTGSRPRAADVKDPEVISTLAFLERGVQLGLGSLEGGTWENRYLCPLLLPAKPVTGITESESRATSKLGHCHLLARWLH